MLRTNMSCAGERQLSLRRTIFHVSRWFCQLLSIFHVSGRFFTTINYIIHVSRRFNQFLTIFHVPRLSYQFFMFQGYLTDFSCFRVILPVFTNFYASRWYHRLLPFLMFPGDFTDFLWFFMFLSDFAGFSCCQVILPIFANF